MPKVSTLTDLANKAMSSIGVGTIADISATDEKSQICLLHIYDAIEDCIDKFNWQELITSVTLTQAPADSPDGVAQWLLPTNFLHLVRIVSAYPVSWTIEADKLLLATDTPPVIVYIKNSEVAAEFGINLYRCVWTKLAASIAMPLTQDPMIWQKAEVYADRTWSRETGRVIQKRRSGSRRGRGNSWQNSRRNSSYPGPNQELTSE